MNSSPGLRDSSAAKSQRSPKFREVRFEDYSQIAALALRFNLHMEECASWTHLWTENPAFRDVAGKLPMGWVLESPDGTVCGYLGNIPLQYELQGQKLLVATTRTWVVDTPFRSYSPMLLASYFQQRNVDLFLSTTVNAQSASAYTTFQSIRVPVGTWDRALFWITNYRGFSRSFLRREKKRLPSAMSYPLSAGVYFFDKLKKSSPRQNAKSLHVEAFPSFDDRFDAFWAELRKQKSHLLLAIRDRESLDWHFKFALLKNRAWIYVVQAGTGVIGYAVFLRHDYRQIGLTRMRLVDFQSLEPDRSAEMLAATTSLAAERCREESIHMLEVVGLTENLETSLRRFAPHERQLAAWLYYYKANSPSLASTLRSSNVWEPSLFDGDSSV